MMSMSHGAKIIAHCTARNIHESRCRSTTEDENDGESERRKTTVQCIILLERFMMSGCRSIAGHEDDGESARCETLALSTEGKELDECVSVRRENGSCSRQ